jgi:cytochrome c peroxidase
MTDQRFINLGLPPMGGGPSAYEYVDYGAAHRSHVGIEGRFAFRTPSLHNVAATGPWMHNGCYTSLEAVVRHRLDPMEGLYEYDRTQLADEFQNQVHTSRDVLEQVEQSRSQEVLDIPALSDAEVNALLVFLDALSSPALTDLPDASPETVPSGLPLVLP